jgi:inner membrane protease ATP23
VNWSDCTHHACSEIRAALLSGDCDWKREFWRGHFALGAQFQKCIRRRAEISVRMNPNCSPLQAKEAVNRAWDICFADTAPFDGIP